ncbi:MAG: type IV secretion system DNA-binding domain-containing protein [Acidobacteriaceae bacterium]
MAKTIWGRKETIIWPYYRPIYTYGAALAALLLMVVFIWCRFRLVNTPLQWFYTPVYARTSVIGSFSRTHRSTDRMLFIVGRRMRPRPAMNDDVIHGKTPESGQKTLPLTLSKKARQQGYDLLFRGPARSYVDARLSGYLKASVYHGSGFATVYKVPLLGGVGVFLLLLPFAVNKDIRRQKELKYGRRLKGPEKLTPKQFNRNVKGDGIGFKTDGMRSMLRIPKRAEAQHIQIIGDTGAGKSALMFQVLRQVRGRGDSAIVYDPAREFVKRFYDPRQGDVILNPLDKRCPYWGPSEELRSRSEAKALAASLFQPPQDKKGEFFIESPQKIFAFLMAYGPTPDELVRWMSNPNEIDRRLKGTEHAHLIDPRAHQQRAGVLGSLGLVADSLRLLPKKGEGNGEWTATEWAEKRQGWIFLTSLPAEREALRPLQSLWIDWLVLRLLNEPTKEQKRVWFVIDELASLQKLPQLHTAITENRKSRNPVVLGFQGKAQLEYLYGHLAEVMLSQPATNVWLTTKEPNAGEWVSKFIGKVEIERLRESHFDGTRAGRNFTIERQVEPLVLESEISGLAELHAYMKYRNYVTYFSFPYFDMPEMAKDFVLRERPDDTLPYDPKTVRAGKPESPPAELAQEPEASAPLPESNVPAAAHSIQPEPVVAPEPHEEHAAVQDGWSL